MKKLLSVLLVPVLFVTALLPAAASGYPESAHVYENNCDRSWEYIHPESAEGLFVTFSDETYVEPGALKYALTGEYSQEELESFLATGESEAEEGDRITLYDRDGELFGWYTGDQLAGRTLYLPGDRFTVRLESDGSGVGYGFSVDSITSELPDDLCLVRYHIGGETVGVPVPTGEPVELNEYYRLRQCGDRVIVGWRTAAGDEYYYNAVDYDESIFAYSPSRTGLTAAGGEEIDLSPIECPISMTADEVFSFTNSAEYFSAELDGYVLEKEHFLRLITAEYVTFGLTPVMPLVAPVTFYMTYYYPTMSFSGSCGGIVITELLQHYGKIDILSAQGVDTVAELEPDDRLLSVINYYAIQGNTFGYAANRMAIDPGTEEYSNQLRALYDTAAAGSPVYFGFYTTAHPVKTIFTPGSGKIKSGHAILVTGAYADADGRHVLIACDNNSAAYVNGYCETLYINEDFTEITYRNTPLKGFSWSDGAPQYDSLPVEGPINPFAWHIEFFKNLLSLFRQIFGLYVK